ncbi:MAG: hypothetical protein JWM64_2785 [Frankiales bacterium]|nr:hypothetical protein [Frankiales bacterium]
MWHRRHVTRFRVERSGGFAGLVLRADVDAAELPGDAVRSASALDWSTLDAPSAGRRDGFTYRLELLPADDALAAAPPRAVELAEPPPPELRPLLDALMQHARPDVP